MCNEYETNPMWTSRDIQYTLWSDDELGGRCLLFNLLAPRPLPNFITKNQIITSTKITGKFLLFLRK